MRHIEKLKKIFTCCGKECSADTNGAALDELLTLAENGELGGGGGVEDKYYLYSIGMQVSEFGLRNLMPEEWEFENGVTNCLVYIKGKPTIEDINEGESLDVYIFGYGNVVKDKILINEKYEGGFFTCTNYQGLQELYKVNASVYSRYDGLFRIPIMERLTVTENGGYTMEPGKDGIVQVSVQNGLTVPTRNCLSDEIESVVGSTGNVIINQPYDGFVYLTLGSIFKGVLLEDIEANGGTYELTAYTGGPQIDSFAIKVKITLTDNTGTKTISAETISVGSSFPTDKPYKIGFMGV